MKNEESPAGAGHGHDGVNILINGKHYLFESNSATGREIKAKANIPDSYSLYLKHEGANEPVADDESVELHNGDHFFSRPPSNVS